MKPIFACAGVLATALISFSASSVSLAQASGEWRPLFNGKDLTGWTVAAGRGGAAAPGAPPPQAAPGEAENGGLGGGEGARRGGPHSTQQVQDFEPELDFLVGEHR